MSPEEHLVHFAALLRENGILVSTGEVMDASCALSVVGVENRAKFRAALRATLVKSPKQRECFDRLFDLYFSGLSHLVEALDEASFQAISEAGTLERGELEKLAQSFRELSVSLSPLGAAALNGNGLSVLSQVRQAALSLDFSRLDGAAQQGFLLRRLRSKLGVDEMARQFDALEAHLRKKGASLDGISLVQRSFRQALAKIERATSEWVDQEAKMRRHHGEEATDDVRNRPFQGLTPEEATVVTQSVQRLAARLRTRLAFRGKSTRRGRLDLRQTLRKSSGRATDGWGKLIFHRRIAIRPELVILCDLSDSVRPTARMMMLFAMALQNMFVRTRTFVFVNEAREVTERLRGLDPTMPLSLAGLTDVVSFGGNSDYGNVFGQLDRGEARSFGARTTLLIIGDGRSNYGDPNVSAFESIARRVGKILWVTPEPEGRWNEGDCELWKYRRECHGVATVARLSDMVDLCDVLVPKGGRRGKKEG